MISFVIKAYKANPALGKWVSKQRDAFREFQNGNQNPKINQEKIEKLKSIGFKFVIGKGKAIRQWDQFFASLVAFKEKFGEKSKFFMFSCLFVCFFFTTKGCSSYVFNISAWNKTGHTNIPLSYKADPQLGRWAYQQRKNNSKKVGRGNGTSAVTRKRLDQLKQIGFNFHLLVEKHGSHKRKRCDQEEREASQKQKSNRYNTE